MNGELRPGGPGDPRPHQQGAAQGDSPTGQRVNATKNWLVDTGATISGITLANAIQFNIVNPQVGVVQGVGGAVPVIIGSGVTMVFQKRGQDGRDHNVSCNLPILLNSSEDIIGLDQLQETKCSVVWDPVNQTGQLVDAPLPRNLLAAFTGQGMVHDVFVKTLSEHVVAGTMTEDRKRDILIQKAHFDAQRDDIARQKLSKVVGFSNGRMLVADSLPDLLQLAQKELPNQALYFEEVRGS